MLVIVGALAFIRPDHADAACDRVREDERVSLGDGEVPFDVIA